MYIYIYIYIDTQRQVMTDHVSFQYTFKSLPPIRMEGQIEPQHVFTPMRNYSSNNNSDKSAKKSNKAKGDPLAILRHNIQKQAYVNNKV